jgi:hypothetical protein
MLQPFDNIQPSENPGRGAVSRQNILIATGLVVLLCGGFAQGLMSHRWLPNAAVQNAALALNDIPSRIGNWTSEDIALADADRKIGGIAGYVQRNYRDRTTGTEVSLLLVVGEPGPISVHPPTACFSGRGYNVVRQPGVLAIAKTDHESLAAAITNPDASTNHIFNQADFSNSAIDDVSLIRVCWAWSTNGHWEAPANPRLQFASRPYLYKLYVSERWIPNGDVNQDAGAAQQFLMTALPVLRERLDCVTTAQDAR